MKKISLLSLLIVLICSTTVFGAVDYPVDVTVNNQFIQFDEKPYLQNSRTMVPIRFVSEALGISDITWVGEEEKVIIKNSDVVVELKVNSNKAEVNGVKMPLDAPVAKRNSRVFVPFRFIGEIFNSTIQWDDRYFIAKIYKDNITVPGNLIKHNYSEDEIFWLGRIIEAESGGESHQGKIAVGNVILNRVKNREFPNTIYDVIFDRNHGVQFQPISNGTIYNNPSTNSIMAAKSALNGVNYVGNALYFLNPRIATSGWITNNRRFLKSIGNHDFYL